MTRTRFDRLSCMILLSTAIVALGCGAGDETQATAQHEADATYDAGPFTVEPGSELVMCTYVRGSNEAEEDIVAFTTDQSQGGHHLIVYTVDHAIDLPASPCNQGGQPGWSQVVVTQVSHDVQAFPEGVGFHVAPHQQYVMETHYINTTAKALTVTSSFGTSYATPGAALQRAATYFFGTMNIDVAAGAHGQASAECHPPQAMTLHTMFGHEHRWGTGVGVAVDRSGGTQSVYQSEVWDNPPIAHFDGGLSLGTDDTVHVTCDFDNRGTSGARYPHEMCFAIGYYWPADSGMVCVSGGNSGDCACQRQGAASSGPGGAEALVTVHRSADITGAGGPIDAGAPIYCGIFAVDDWSGLTPKAGASPRYFRDAIDSPMTNADTAVPIHFQDVSPGDYKVSCMMDTIGGGWVLGSGDVIAIQAADLHVAPGGSATADVVLDFAMP